MEDTSSVLQAGWGDVIGSFARVEREMMSTAVLGTLFFSEPLNK